MILVPVALLCATIALNGAAAWSLRETASPRVGCEPPEGVAVRVVCPLLGVAAAVRVAVSLANPAFVVVSCERFPDGACECDRACFPLDLERRRPFGIAARA
ncbi:MAG: hypothetical protein DMD60_07315 [Gemmatimonadetes bacterium]|nr:MAG: hypothetical protein DMD60_07315 [Gemmatimonadota bacterium]